MILPPPVYVCVLVCDFHRRLEVKKTTCGDWIWVGRLGSKYPFPVSHLICSSFGFKLHSHDVAQSGHRYMMVLLTQHTEYADFTCTLQCLAFHVYLGLWGCLPAHGALWIFPQTWLGQLYHFFSLSVPNSFTRKL